MSLNCFALLTLKKWKTQHSKDYYCHRGVREVLHSLYPHPTSQDEHVGYPAQHSLPWVCKLDVTCFLCHPDSLVVSQANFFFDNNPKTNHSHIYRKPLSMVRTFRPAQSSITNKGACVSQNIYLGEAKDYFAFSTTKENTEITCSSHWFTLIYCRSHSLVVR